MKNKNQLIGGISGIIEGCLYILGFILMLVILQPDTNSATTEIEKLKFLIDNKVIYQAGMTLIYVVFGIVLIPLTIAINENFKEQVTIWTKSASVFGFIWSGLVIASGMIAVTGVDAIEVMYRADPFSALTSWRAIESIQNGIGGGVEIVGGLWVFLISIIGLKKYTFAKFLNYFGLIVGSAGLLTIFPVLKDLGAIFGVTQIIWFLWIGFTLIKKA